MQLQMCNVKIGITDTKKGILSLLELPYMDIFVTDLDSTNVHVVPWGKVWCM